MATSNNRDVKMTLSVETLGAEGIKQLQNSIQTLAKGGGDAAPEFKKLADEIDRLGEQAGALRTFEQLNAEIVALGAQQAAAAAKVDQLKQSLASAATTTENARQTQAQATAEFKRAQDALETTNGALKILRNSYDESGKRVANYKADLQRLITTQVEQAAAVRTSRDAQATANKELDAAESAQKKIVTSLGKQEKALGSLNNALQTQQGALREQITAVEAFDLSTTDLSASQAKLLQAINSTGQGAQRLAASLEEARVAEQAKAVQEAESLRLQQEKIAAINNEIKFIQQSAAQRQALTEQQSAAERKAAAERAAALAKEQADEAAAYNKRVADLNKEITVRNQLAKERENAARTATAAETAANDKARAEQEAADKASFNKRLADLNTEIKYRRQLATERATLAKQAADAEVAAAQKAATEQKAAAEKAADAISKAFNTAGAQSATGLRQQINDVRVAMDLLGNQAGLTGRELTTAMSAGNAKIKELERELRAATGQMTLADRAAGLFANSLGQIAAGNLIADGIGSLINQIKDMGRQFLTANLEMERLTRTMTQITGSAAGAAEKIKVLRDTANLAGVAVGEITDSFIRFNASAQTAGLASSQVDQIFQAVTVSGSKMGLTSDRVALALDALGQIASKGTVSMEELRQQLGDSLPGALAISAKGLGVTTEQLVKMVETGQLAASEFFPAFKRGLEDSFGSSAQRVEGLFQAFNRLRNAFRELYQEAADSTAFKALASTMDFLAANLRTVVDVTYGLGKALVALKVIEFAKNFLDLGTAAKTSATGIATKTAAVVADTTATVANTTATAANTAAKVAAATATTAVATATVGATTAKTAATVAAGVLSTAWAGLAGAARGVLSLIGGFPGLFVAVALNARDLGTAIGEQAAKWVGWGKVMDDAQAKLRAAEQVEKDAAAAREARTAQLEQALKREILEYANKVTALTSSVAATEKATEATRKQGDFEMRLAGLYGDTAVAAQSAVTASQNNVVAAEIELAKKRELILAIEDELMKRKVLIASGAEVTAKFKEETAALDALLAKKKEETSIAATSVEAARLEAAQRRISVETLKDNSGRLDEFAQAAQKAKERVEDLTRAQQIGLPVDDLLKKAKIDLAEKTRLHSDAMTDNIRKIEQSSQAKKAESDTIIAGLEARRTELESLAKSAEAQGRDGEAVNLKVQAKRIEIQIIQETVKAIEAEVAANIKKLQAQRDAIKGTDDESAARRRDLEIQIKQEEARRTEAQSRLNNIRNINDEINAIMKAGGARDSETSAIERNNAARERAIAAREKENELREREIALENKRRNVDKEGFSLNTNGQRISESVFTPNYVFNAAKSAGLDEATALRLMNGNYINQDRSVSKDQFTVANEAIQAEVIRQAQRRVANEQGGAGSLAAGTPRPAGTSAPPAAIGQAPARANAPVPAKTYNVQIGGSTIRTSSDADAQKLIGALKSASLAS